MAKKSILRNESGQAFIYLLIVIAVLSVLSVAGSETFATLGGISKRELARTEADNLRQSIVMVYSDQTICSSTLAQAGGQFAVEFTAAAKNTSYQTSPALTIPYPTVGGAHSNLNIAGPGMASGILNIKDVVISTVAVVKNSKSPAYIAAVQVDFAATTGLSYVPQSIQVPFYFVTDNNYIPNSCVATLYSSKNQTIQDFACQMIGASYHYDPSVSPVGVCIQ